MSDKLKNTHKERLPACWVLIVKPCGVIYKKRRKEYQRVPRAYVLVKPSYEWLLERAKEVSRNTSVLFRELKLRGYNGSYETVKKWVSPLRSNQSKSYVCFKTSPSEQSQVDWENDFVWIADVLTRIHCPEHLSASLMRMISAEFGYHDSEKSDLIDVSQSIKIRTHTWFATFINLIL